MTNRSNTIFKENNVLITTLHFVKNTIAVWCSVRATLNSSLYIFYTINVLGNSTKAVPMHAVALPRNNFVWDTAELKT